MNRRTTTALRTLALSLATLAILAVAPATAIANVGIPAGYIVGQGIRDVLVAGAFTAITSAIAIRGLRRMARTNAALAASTATSSEGDSNAV
jgi:hypothetical protein